ncbi:Putative Zn-dependent protease, contains TPR repeats [Malonomonas rubra DSM 5091]|uniref:Putative Zn-dependent protease, contains TPR repeats n=1 Tax=Malonomonas rubra DSM 5091 TaxID=1122189 RepID=A0A1M6KJG7_MALRU|nr:M48 family metalloprotease [Malonomonas rubra]SHJ58980.1 Putative Zn-dependent protease, contains TPR repeats [Malonomonas rubra DSM 5091]
MDSFKRFFWLLTVLSLLAGCAVNPVTGRNELAIMQVSPAQEVELGRKSFGQAMQSMGGIYPDDSVNAYVDRVGQRVARYSHRPELSYQFKVVNDSSPNAFALPGGFIAISRGLLINLENEAQLAAVLGHEVGHVTARHSVQGMQRATLLNAAVGLAGVAAGEYSELATQIGGVTANLIDKRYSREQESESDQLGIDYMAQAGYAPQGAVELQEIFYRKIDQGQNADWLSGLFRSHPFSIERLQANRNYVEARYPTSRASYGLDRNAYLTAIDPVLQTKEAYALYDEAKELEAKGQLDVAIETYHKAMQKAPEHGLLLNGLGMAYLRSEDLIPARRYLIKAVNVDPEYFQSRMGLGYVYLKNQDPAEASKHLKKSLELMPSVQSAYLLGEAEEAQGHIAQARELYQAVADADANGKLGQAATAKLKRLGQ